MEFKKNDEQAIIGLCIQFDNIESVTVIEKYTSRYEVSETERSSRTQFPILVSYAITIHKCQGISVDNVITDISDSFCSGMWLVALILFLTYAFLVKLSNVSLVILKVIVLVM